MKKTVMFLGMLSAGYAYSQQGKVGINTSEPKATLEIAVASANTNANTNEGLLIPRLSKARVEKMPSPEDGTLVYVDNVAHTSTNAKISEITQKGFYYYRKDLTKWVKIANGIAGADGASMLTGNGTPQNNTGANGDSYVDQNTGNIWTKANNTWTNTNKSLKGAQGIPGQRGPIGQQGPAGQPGTPGAKGDRGPAGPAGAKGASMLTGTGTPPSGTGVNGDSYVDQSTGNIWTKANNTWTNTNKSLKGANGIAGQRGPTGPQGPAGTYVNSTSVTVSGTQLHRAALTGDVTAAANSNATTIANNAINSAKIADGTVEGVDIKDGTIEAKDLKPGVLQNIYTHNGTLTESRNVNIGAHSLTFKPNLGSVVIGGSDMITLDVRGLLRIGDLVPLRTGRMNYGKYRLVPGDRDVVSVLREPGIEVVSTSYVLNEWDHGSHIYVDSSTPVDITIPANLPREFSCVVVQKGAGQVTVKGNGVTLQTARGIKTRKQFSAIGIIKDTANTATITGDAIK